MLRVLGGHGGSKNVSVLLDKAYANRVEGRKMTAARARRRGWRRGKRQRINPAANKYKWLMAS
jgi:hypothetical protein